MQFDNNYQKSQDLEKLKISQKYVNLLIRMLDKVLKKLIYQRGDYNNKEGEFMGKFLALAYFRIPAFRNKIMEAINKQIKYKSIPEREWKNAHWDIN